MVFTMFWDAQTHSPTLSHSWTADPITECLRHLFSTVAEAQRLKNLPFYDNV